MNHEQSFADGFNKFMKRRSEEENFTFHSFSVDGQDRDVGGDYVISDSTRFAIVEFKYTESEFMDESRKPRRLRLCENLVSHAEMRVLHDKCHFVSWSDSVTGVGYANIYRKEICNQVVFGKFCGLSAVREMSETRKSLSKFSAAFFSGKAWSATLEEFERYVAWVMTETSGSERTTLELLGYEPDMRELIMVRLSSIAAAHAWMQRHRMPPPTPSYRSPSP